MWLYTQALTCSCLIKKTLTHAYVALYLPDWPLLIDYRDADGERRLVWGVCTTGVGIYTL
jgi:hypothetical protein